MANWIKKATANSHGQFRAKAQKAGMSTASFARSVMSNADKHDEETRKQANLALTLMKEGRKRRKSTRGSNVESSEAEVI